VKQKVSGLNYSVAPVPAPFGLMMGMGENWFSVTSKAMLMAVTAVRQRWMEGLSVASESRRRYRYGLFLNPQKRDPVVASLEAAESEARKMSLANNGTPVAVWDSSDRTIKLFAGYEVFEPARH
jgi:hypothetical protein